ncbi:prokaryotic N- methylation motif domain protein, partial [Vibrio anguillarum]|nr:prokaryotic N- methylation motif domain protein [Vibrio anguillarum]
MSKVTDNAPEMKRAFGSYAGVDNAFVYNSTKMVEVTTKSPTSNQFITPYSTDGLTIAPTNATQMVNGTNLTGTNRFLMVTIKSVPKHQCQDTVLDFFNSALEVRVGTVRVPDAPSATT